MAYLTMDRRTVVNNQKAIIRAFTVVAFVQGAAVGTMIYGIPVVNNQYVGARYGSGRFRCCAGSA
jgi:hypothetical protein